MVIDIYCHHISRRVGQILSKLDYYKQGGQFTYKPENADPDVRLGVMDKYGIDIQVISQTTPVLMGFNAEEAAEICSISNDDNHALCKQYPDRFVNVCILSLLDVDSALKELERCIDGLDCRGVTISSNQNGKGLDSPEYFPIYEELAKYDLPILIHPTNWDCSPLVSIEEGWRMMHVFGWPFDTTQAVWRLIFGGVLDRYPTLKIITHHLGAMLPYFTNRIEMSFNRYLKSFVPRHITEYWQNIYGDTAVDGAVAAYQCGYSFFGPDRMMFGTDYPFGPEAGEYYIKVNLDAMEAMDISDENKKKILSENAVKLFKI